MPSGTRWSREEIIVALALYHQIPFSKINKTNPDIVFMAGLLQRTPSALSMKMGNLARFDKTLIDRNIGGLANGAKMDEAVWNEFEGRLGELSQQNARILSELRQNHLKGCIMHDVGENLADTPESDWLRGLPLGSDIDTVTKARIGQQFFHRAVFSNYENRCCITGIEISELLRASHIKPWASSTGEEKTNPANGLCLNALHDAAFDRGLITVAPDFVVHVSSQVPRGENISDAVRKNIIELEGTKIHTPYRLQPAKEFLQYHNDVVFAR